MGSESKYSGYSDNDLLNEYKTGGNNALVGVLYERYGHLVLGLCIKYLKNKDEAKDATVQIFTGLLDDLKKHQVTYFKSWLYTYSKNFCLMQLRKRQSQLKRDLELHENIHLVVDFSDPEHLNEKERQINLLEQAIGMLSEDQKRCIELFYLEKRSYNDIVEITGYSANEVKSFIQNGKRNLKLKMESLGYEQKG